MIMILKQHWVWKFEIFTAPLYFNMKTDYFCDQQDGSADKSS